MTITERGRLLSVRKMDQGSALLVATASGTTTLSVESVIDFSEEGGQLMFSDGVIKTYDSIDMVANTIHITATAGAVYPIEDTVLVYPPSSEFEADVALDDVTGQLIQATIPAYLVPYMPTGIEDTFGPGVLLEQRDDGDWRVVDLTQVVPTMDLTEFGDPTTYPPPPSDGSPPSTAPVVQVFPGIGILHLRWDGVLNPDTILGYKVYASTVSGFTPGPTNFITDTPGTLMTLRVDASEVPLVYGVTYYVKVIPYDADGDGPTSTEASGVPVQADIADLAVGYLQAGGISVSDLLAGTLSAETLISALMRTAISGRRVEIDTQGIRSIASDETLMVDIPTDKGTATFNGQVLAAALEVLGNSTHRGIGTLTPGAAFVLSLSVPDPITAPTVSVVWDTTEFSDGARSRAGLYWDAANSRWWTGRNFASSGNEVCDIKAYDASGVLQQTIAQSNMPVNAIECAGAVRIGTKVYALLHTWATFPVAVNRWAVHSFDATTGAYIDESTWSDSPSGLVQSNDGIPGFGYDGTNLIVVGITSGGAPTFTKLTVADSPVLVSTTTSTGLALSMTFPRTMSGFAVAEGAWWISTHGGTATGTVYKFTTAGALVTNSDFFTRNFTAIYGLGHDGTQFWTLDAPSIVMVKHTNWIWTTENSGYWVGYTWQNPNETLVSPRASITMYRRAKMRVSNPALQVGASSVRVYTNRGSTEPQAGGRFDGEPQVTDALTVRDLVTFATGTQNPATNTFGAATPAELRSSGGEPLLRANGVPRCRLRTTSSRGIPTGTDHYIRLGTEDVDTDGFHAATTDADSATPDSTYNLVLPFAGSYMAIFRCVWAAGSGGQRQAFLDIGPGTIERITLEVGGGALSVRGNAAWDLDTATTGVIIRLGVLQDSGVALGLSTARLFIWYLGP